MQGNGKAVLNNGDILEGMFENGRPSGIIRVTFSTGRVVYAMYEYGTRRGWLRGESLEKLEDAWLQATESVREDAARHARGLAIMARANMFSFGKAVENKEAADQAEKESEAKMEARLVKMKEKPKQTATTKGVQAGAFNITASMQNRL